jgi:starch synthase
MGIRSVLFVATEAFPFVKTGGLGEVIGSLPRELARRGVDVRVILPKFSAIANCWRERMTALGSFEVYLGWRRQYCGLETVTLEGVPFYFVDNEYYFKRPGLYGWADDAECFAFFCRAVLEVLPRLDFAPRILHCHDWQTAIVPVLLKTQYYSRTGYSELRTVLTIHNAEYQGIFDRSVVGDLLSLAEDKYFTCDRLELGGAVNYLKAGIVFADLLTTVSGTYAWEITTPEGGRGLDGWLRKREGDLCGIVNGIDYDIYDPARDEAIFANYSVRAPKGKQDNKARLQEYLGLPVKADVPLIGMVTRLVAAKGLDLVAAALAELMSMGVQMVIMGEGDEKYAGMLRVAADGNPEGLSVLTHFDEAVAHRIFAGSDLYLQPSLSEPCGTSQLMAMRYGSIPVVRETGGLKDTVVPYNEYSGRGNGFSFRGANVQEMLCAIDRAISFYRDKKTWKKIVRAAMKTDHSWRRSANEYVSVYDSLCG